MHFREPLTPAICLSLMAHLSVLWFSSQSPHTIFFDVEKPDQSVTTFQIDLKVIKGESVNSSSQANLFKESQEKNTTLMPLSHEAKASVLPPITSTQAVVVPTLSNRPIGFYKTSPWGGRFVNTTQTLLNKTNQFINQLEPILINAEFSGRCIIYLGPSDFLAYIRCDASQEHVSQIMNTLNLHFQHTSELTEYWRCIVITNSTASIKEKCDAL